MQLHADAPSDPLHPWQARRHALIHTIKLTGGHILNGQQDAKDCGQTCKIRWHAAELSELVRLQAFPRQAQEPWLSFSVSVVLVR